MTFIENGAKKYNKGCAKYFYDNKEENTNGSVRKEQISEFKMRQRKKEQSFKQINKLQYCGSLILTISSNKHEKYVIYLGKKFNQLSVGVFDVYLLVEWITHETIMKIFNKLML